MRVTACHYVLQPLERATVCRRAHGSCDLPEFCDGESERCPSDVFVKDGVECEDDRVRSSDRTSVF